MRIARRQPEAVRESYPKHSFERAQSCPVPSVISVMHQQRFWEEVIQETCLNQLHAPVGQPWLQQEGCRCHHRTQGLGRALPGCFRYECGLRAENDRDDPHRFKACGCDRIPAAQTHVRLSGNGLELLGRVPKGMSDTIRIFKRCEHGQGQQMGDKVHTFDVRAFLGLETVGILDGFHKRIICERLGGRSHVRR